MGDRLKSAAQDGEGGAEQQRREQEKTDDQDHREREQSIAQGGDDAQARRRRDAPDGVQRVLQFDEHARGAEHQQGDTDDRDQRSAAARVLEHRLDGRGRRRPDDLAELPDHLAASRLLAEEQPGKGDGEQQEGRQREGAVVGQGGAHALRPVVVPGLARVPGHLPDQPNDHGPSPGEGIGWNVLCKDDASHPFAPFRTNGTCRPNSTLPNAPKDPPRPLAYTILSEGRETEVVPNSSPLSGPGAIHERRNANGSRAKFCRDGPALGGKTDEEARRTGAVDKADEQVESLFKPQYQTGQQPDPQGRLGRQGAAGPVRRAAVGGVGPVRRRPWQASLDIVRRRREAGTHLRRQRQGCPRPAARARRTPVTGACSSTRATAARARPSQRFTNFLTRMATYDADGRRPGLDSRLHRRRRSGAHLRHPRAEGAFPAQAGEWRRRCRASP